MERANIHRLPGSARCSLYLRDVSDADSGPMFSWINDHALVILSAPFSPVSRHQHDAWFSAVRNNERIRIFTITDGKSNRAIGYCQLKNIDNVSQSAELQIRIGDPSCRNLGIGTKAVTELLRFGFEVLNLHRIFLHVFTSNVPAYKTYRKVGFREEGVLRDGVKVEGKFIDIAIMSMLRDEFIVADENE